MQIIIVTPGGVSQGLLRHKAMKHINFQTILYLEISRNVHVKQRANNDTSGITNSTTNLYTPLAGCKTLECHNYKQ